MAEFSPDLHRIAEYSMNNSVNGLLIRIKAAIYGLVPISMVLMYAKVLR